MYYAALLRTTKYYKVQSRTVGQRASQPVWGWPVNTVLANWRCCQFWPAGDEIANKCPVLSNSQDKDFHRLMSTLCIEKETKYVQEKWRQITWRQKVGQKTWLGDSESETWVVVLHACCTLSATSDGNLCLGIVFFLQRSFTLQEFPNFPMMSLTSLHNFVDQTFFQKQAHTSQSAWTDCAHVGLLVSVSHLQ